MFVWILLAILFSGLFYWKIIKPHRYWKDKGVKQGKQYILIGDSIGAILRTQSIADFVEYVYNKIPNERYSGMYQFLMPTLVLKDPELIKQITVKDFDHFTDHLTLIPEDYEQLWSRNLISLKGDKWRDMRATLSPAFTSSKMKSMFALISECSEQFAKYLEKNSIDTSLELKDIFSRFANDVIATCAFGIKCDSLEDRNNEFYLMGKEATDFSGLWRNMKLVLFISVPRLCKLFGVTFFSKKVAKFFTKLVVETVKTREEKNIIRADMIDLLMEARKGKLFFDEKTQHSKEAGFATVEESEIGKTAIKQQEITDNDMTAQALQFFFAGFDSVSILMCFMGQELAINPDIQERLQLEIDETLKNSNGKITYEAINKMKYLDMVVTETLRKWPSTGAVDRLCTKAYTIKAINPGEVDVHLSKGDLLWLPIWGLHHDPQYYPNPDKFDPERFNDENKLNIVPYTYIPFGSGPRNCIGSRFALLEVKTVFVHLLSKINFVVNEKTDIPIKLSKKGISMNAENGFWVTLKQRTRNC